MRVGLTEKGTKQKNVGNFWEAFGAVQKKIEKLGRFLFIALSGSNALN
jgi:hypothetical protein